MKKLFMPILFFLIFIPVSAQDFKMDEIIKVIEEVKSQFAPDKRTAIFQVSVENNSGNINLTGETNLPKAKQTLLNKLKEAGFNFSDHVKLLPSEELGEKIYGLVNLSVANIRTNPAHSAELATQALLGTPVKILKKNSDFYLVQTPDNYIAWVDNDGIIPVNKAKLDEWLNSEKIFYKNEYGFAYSKPDETSQRISDLTAGNVLVKLGEEENYFNVKYPDGRTAFVNKKHFVGFSEKINEAVNSDDIIKTAKLYMGIPYLWGGTSAKGVDCSGFTKTVFFLNNIILERDASQQVNQGELIDTQNGFQNLQHGDLLFFGFHATDSTKERVTHVGIYIGNSEYIHASGKVKINSLDRNAPNFSEFRLTHFIRAKRILNSVNKNGLCSIGENKFFKGEF
jgi:cell wall-associated NlpC family hydrolase